MNDYEKLDAQCVSPAKDFETIIFNIKDLTSLQETRLNGLKKLSDKLIGKQNVSENAVPMPTSNTPLESFQGQLEESIIILNRLGTETDKILERLHDKI